MKSIGLGLFAILLSALLTRAMIRVSVLDMPGHRSSHARPTPKGGGIGVMAAFLAGVPAAFWLLGGNRHGLAGMLAGTFLLALVSWLDDIRQFPPLAKLLAQIVAASLILAAIGLSPGGLPPWIALAGGFCWLLYATNALNFIDGLNGLAAGCMALASLFIGLTAPAPGLERYAALMLAAGLAGFLPFNYPRARIFLGDVGSQGAGLAVAGLGLLRWQDPGHWTVLAMPLLLWGILYDVGFTLIRRWRAGARLSEAHRGHLYQVAFRAGIGAPWIALLHWGFVAWGGVLALLLAQERIGAVAAVALACIPQIAWTLMVRARAARAAIGQW